MDHLLGAVRAALAKLLRLEQAAEAHRLIARTPSGVVEEGLMPKATQKQHATSHETPGTCLGQHLPRYTRIGISTYNPLGSAASCTTVGAAPSAKRNST
jgi:hypothetical protein